MQARASACECPTDVIYNSDPKDQATGVPLNQALVVEGNLRTSSIRLKDEHAAAVAFDLNQGPTPGGCPSTWAELLPKQPLAPNTRYEIQFETADSTAAAALSFTTGTAELPTDDLPLPSTVHVTVLSDAPAACDRTIFGCLWREDPDSVELELIARTGSEIVMRTLDVYDGVYGMGRVPDCIEVRRRARTGQRSEPRTICGDALAVRAWRETDSAQGVLICGAGKFGEESGVVAEPGQGHIIDYVDTEVSAAAGSAASDSPAVRNNGPRVPAPRSSSGCSVAFGPVAAASGEPWLTLLASALGSCLCRGIRRSRRLE